MSSELDFGHGPLVSWPLHSPPMLLSTFSQIIPPKYSLLKLFYRAPLSVLGTVVAAVMTSQEWTCCLSR